MGADYLPRRRAKRISEAERRAWFTSCATTVPQDCPQASASPSTWRATKQPTTAQGKASAIGQATPGVHSGAYYAVSHRYFSSSRWVPVGPRATGFLDRYPPQTFVWSKPRTA